MSKKILVRIPKEEGLPFYRRAGFTFKRGEDNVVMADDEKIAILRADPLIAVGDVAVEPEKPVAKK